MKVKIKLNDLGRQLLDVDFLEFDNVESVRSHNHVILWKK